MLSAPAKRCFGFQPVSYTHLTYFLFTNHIKDNRYTDAVYVYCSKDPCRWDAECCKILVDASVSTWAHGAIGLATVTKADAHTLAVVYDLSLIHIYMEGDAFRHRRRDRHHARLFPGAGLLRAESRQLAVSVPVNIRFAPHRRRRAAAGPVILPTVSYTHLDVYKRQVLILRDLLTGTKRFGELKKSVGNVSQKVLTAQLRAMEESGLLTRTVYALSLIHIWISHTRITAARSPRFFRISANIPSLFTRASP